MNNFSPNMLKTFEECQQKFYLKYIQKISVPQQSKVFEKGKKIHALASYYLKGENIAKLEKVLTEEEKKIWQELKNNKYFNLRVENTEYNLSCKIGKHWVGGRLDALVSDGGEKPQKDCSYFILDYKTGNIPKNAKWDFQTIVYLLCSDKFLKLKGGYKNLKFVYLGLKTLTEEEIELDDSLKTGYEAKVVEICDKIDLAELSNSYPKNKERCKLCEYNKICYN